MLAAFVGTANADAGRPVEPAGILRQLGADVCVTEILQRCFAAATTRLSLRDSAIVELSHLFNNANDVVDPEAEYDDANKEYEYCNLPPE